MTADQLAPDQALPRSTPSAQGIDAAGIDAFVTALETAADVEPHGLMILRHGRVAAEGWWAPYTPGRAHLLYSLSKSFTSTAVGLAEAEGLLSLDDTVIGHFPELDAEITDSRSRRIRVRHLLAMATGHREETIERAVAIDPVDLVRGFLLIPPDEEPGSLFCYNQPCTFTLAAIVQRTSGRSLVEYLGPRLFEPLGIRELGWQRDVSGRELGFTGFHASTEAVAKLGQLYLRKGVWAGRQVVPATWVEEATRSHIDSSAWGNPDWQQGYGFQFWMARHGYRGDGAYGQFCVILPEHDVVVAMTGQSVDMQAVLDAAWTHLLPAIGRDSASSDDDSLAGRLSELALRPLPATEPFTGEFTAAEGNDQPTLKRATLLHEAEAWSLRLVDGRDTITVPVGRGEWAMDDVVAASGGMTPEGLSGVDVVFIETPHRLHLTFDQAAGTFVSRWETAPLHEPPLVELRMPRG